MDITTIQSLIQQARRANDPASNQAFAGQLQQAWGQLVERQLTQFTRQTSTVPPKLRPVVWQELGHLLKWLPPEHSAYVANQADRIAAELVDVAHWKMSVPAEPLEAVTIWGKNRQADILRWMDAAERQTGPTYLKQLLAYLDTNDRLAVANRTLRALAYCVIQNNRPLFGLYNGHVMLSEEAGRGYFFDQVALYVYLYKNKEEAFFLHDALLKVRAYARQKLLQRNTPEADAVAKDVMGKVQLDFVRQYDKQRTDPFFLDVQMSTYLISFVDKQPEIKGSRKEELLPENYDPPADDPPESDTIWQRILNYCKQQIGKNCKLLIDMRYNNGLSQPLSFSDMAAKLGMGVGEVEGKFSRCKLKLRECVIAECKRQNLPFYPR